MIKKNLLSLFLTGIAFANSDLSTLLKNYEIESELSKQTRVESLGNSVIFTRQDIERMQFDKLSDVLKYVKVTSFQKTRFGVNSLVLLGTVAQFPSSIRLYLNDKDLSSVYTDSPFFNYSNLSLTHIDHIEVYLGAAAIKLGNYPSSIVVKLYTKKPERENGTLIKERVYNNGSNITDIFTAQTVDENSDYLILVNKEKKNSKKESFHNQNVYSDSKQNYSYLNYRYRDSLFEFSFLDISSDAFMGLSVDNAPDKPNKDTLKNREYYFMYTYDNNDYKFNFSYSNNRIKKKENNKKEDGGLFLPQYSTVVKIPLPTGEMKIVPLTPTFVEEDRDLKKYNFSISKNFKTDRNHLFTSISMQIRENNINKLNYELNGKIIDGKKIENINFLKNYSAVLEEQYNINDRNLIFTSLKGDKYVGDGNYKSTNNYIARVGYITIPTDNFKLKAFLTRSYVPVTILAQEFASDRELKQTMAKAATIETNYKKGKHNFNFGYGATRLKNLIVYDQDGAKNLDKQLNARYIMLGYKYNFNLSNKMELDYSRMFLKDTFSTKESLIAKYVSSFEKYDFFSGLVYNAPYKSLGVKVDSSYNVDIGMIYHLNKIITLKLKGENIFDDSSKIVYKSPFETGSYQNDVREFSVAIEIGF